MKIYEKSLQIRGNIYETSLKNHIKIINVEMIFYATLEKHKTTLSTLFNVSLESKGSKAATREVAKMDRKTNRIVEYLTPRKLSQHACESTIFGFGHVQKKIDLGLALDAPFGAFGNSINKKPVV